jgi:hypothetical protein
VKVFQRAITGSLSWLIIIIIIIIIIISWIYFSNVCGKLPQTSYIKG